MIKTQTRLLAAAIAAITIYGCGAVPVGNRYGERSTGTDTRLTPDEGELHFDIGKYRSIPEITEPKAEGAPPPLWFSYDDETVTTAEPIKAPGYRVLVFTTDIFEEADSVKSQLYLAMTTKAVYIDFTPPYYKVKAGDLLNRRSAEELSFRLSQTGFGNTSIVEDSVWVKR